MVDFNQLFLTDKEKKAIKTLKRKHKLHESEIDCFSALNRYGFLTHAHPESIKPDAYGGFITDGYYCLSETYERYKKYLWQKRFPSIVQSFLQLIGFLK